MNPHLRSALLLVGLVGLAVVIWLLRYEKWVHDDPTALYDRLLIVLGVAFVAAVVSYVLTLRRKATPDRGESADAPSGDATTGDETADSETPDSETPESEAPAGAGRRAREIGIERLVGKKAGRIVNIVLLALVGVVVVFLIGFLGYILYLQFFAGP
jgi:hypothetical protein